MPPNSSQAGAGQNMEAMVHDLVKSSLTQFAAIPKETPDQSRAQSDTVDLETPPVEDISSEGEIFYSDQELQSGTPVFNELLMGKEELDDYDSFTSPVADKTPLYKFAEHTPQGSQAQSKTKTATAQVQPVTGTLVKTLAPQHAQDKASAQAQPQVPAQAQMRSPAPAQPHRLAPAYFSQPQAAPPRGG